MDALTPLERSPRGPPCSPPRSSKTRPPGSSRMRIACVGHVDRVLQCANSDLLQMRGLGDKCHDTCRNPITHRAESRQPLSLTTCYDAGVREAPMLLPTRPREERTLFSGLVADC